MSLFFKSHPLLELAEKGNYPNFMEVQAQLFSMCKMWYATEKNLKKNDTIQTNSPFLPDELRKISLLSLAFPVEYSGRDEIDILMKILEDRTDSFCGVRFRELIIDIYATFDPVFILAYKTRIEHALLNLQLLPAKKEELIAQLEQVNEYVPWYWIIQPYQQAVGMYELEKEENKS